MGVLECSDCGAKVETNRCCGAPMSYDEGVLSCAKCDTKVEVNRCCGRPMKEKK